MKRFISIQLGGGMYASTKIAMLSFILSIFFIPVVSNSQCNMACNDVVQISIGADCNAEITPDALLEGTIPVGSYTIEFKNGQIGTAASGSDLITGIDWGTLLGSSDYTITADGCSNSCWGNAVVEQNIFPEYDGTPECTFIAAQEGSVNAEITLDNIASGVEVEITLPDCSGLGVLPTFSIGDPITFACTSALSGWCTINCEYEIAGLATADGFTTWTLDVSIIDPDAATEYLNTGAQLICTVNYDQPACVPCETWCGGNPPDFVTMQDLLDNLALTTGDCVKNITNLREVVKTEGDVCDGIITVVEYYGDFTQHGITDTRLLLSQAYKQLPIPLIKDDGELNPNVIFPPRTVVDCGESTDPIDMMSIPVFHNLWRDSITYPDTCKLVHYLVAVDTVREPIEIIPGVWSIQDVVKKELRDSTRCAPDSSLDQRIIINPFEPLYPSKFCNLISSYSDQETPICGNGKKIIRDWTIVDWCKAKLVERSQVIEQKDTDAPVGPTAHTKYVVGTTPWTCEPIFDFDLPVFTDKCDNALDITFDIINSEGIWVPVEALTPGSYLIEFIARDDCNNYSKPHTDTLVVIDDVPPVAVCKDKLVVSITPDMNDGVAKILSDDFDKSSHDGGCGVITKKQVIRVEDYIESVDYAFGGMTFAGLPVTCHPETGEVTVVDKDKFGDAIPPVTNELSKWHTSVKFCCQDIGSDKQVILRVWDQANNYNDCVVNVEVQDKLGTLFACPDAITIKCTEYSKDVLFGDAITDFVCSEAVTSYEDDITGLNGCGAGRVIRLWSSDNGSGQINTCPQIITVQNENVFDPLSIRWPIHYKGGIPGTGVRLEPKDSVCVEIPGQTINFGPVLSCVDEEPSCVPEYTEAESCGLVGTSMSADTVFQTDNTCMKIIKRWTVIDWCTWSPNGDRTAEVGDDENDTSADQFQLVEDWCIESGCIVENEGSAYYRYLPSEQGGFVERDGYYTYDQIILYHDDMDPEFLMMEVDTMQPGTEGSCLGNIALINTARDQGFCGSELLQWYVTLLDSTGTQFGNIQTGLGNAFGFTVSDIPLGKYTIVWNVKDGCGNEASQNTAVELVDTSKPTPICIQNISTAVMNTNGEVQIWAADFDPDLKSFDPCDDRVFYSFSPDSIVSNKTLTCFDVLSGTEEMKVWVHDITGNSAACTVNIRVDDNGVCDDYVHTCTAVGGELLTVESDLKEVTLCSTNGVSTFIAKVWENEGNSSFVVTDDSGNILDIPTGPNFSFAGIAEGVCNLYHVSSQLTLTGLSVGNNLSDIEGCFDLSNPIRVTKVNCDPCGVAGGRFITDITDEEEITICVTGDDTSFDAKVWENIGDNSGYVSTDSDGVILSFHDGTNFDFAGSNEGVCNLYHISSNGDLDGYTIGENINDVQGCFSLSNPIVVIKVNCNDCGVVGGKLITNITDLEEITVCVSGNNTFFDAKVWESVGNPGFLITDADGNIKSLPSGPRFDFAGESVGVCFLWHISSDGTLTGLEVGGNASNINGCFSLSNPIVVTKVDSGAACETGDGRAAITGTIATAYGEYIGQARVKLDNPDMAEFPVSKMTSGLTGNYAFTSNPMYSDYSLSVEKDDDYVNGVSTLDLVFIQHHILGLKALDSPYKVIAADINNDQKISASDLVQLRKLILGVISELPTNESWRFVDATQTFTNIYSPWPFTESLDIVDLDIDMPGQNFVGVKTGDVNASASPSSLKTSEVRSNSSVTLTTADQQYKTGDLVEVSLHSEEFDQVSGLQFTLSHPGLELIGVNSEQIDIDSDNIANHGNLSSVSWHSDDFVNASEEIMTFVFVATDKVIKLSETLQINDRIISAEIYTGVEYDINTIKLEFETPTTRESQFELLQNEPNPFSAYTEIGFRLPKADEATLKLFDVTGRLIHSQTGLFGQGLNKITISSDLIGSGGLIYYSLESGNYSATRKMISLK